jgi:exopolysaccharide biosynthesis polyprenyl glycosylphosphotransferase
MSELITSTRLGTPASADLTPQYARMIPGVSAIPASRYKRKPSPTSNRAASINKKATLRSLSLRHLLLPHPIADPLTLYKSVIADFLAISIVCGLQSRLLPAWSFSELALPSLAVLITLFAFSEGVYRGTADPLPADILPGLTRSVVFAITPVFLATVGTVRLRAVPATFATALAALLLHRQLRQIAWARHRDLESRRVLIVGAGPTAQCIARSLRKDPSHHRAVCGFVDDESPLSPEVLGRIADLDWLARGEFIDEVILALPGETELTHDAAEIAFRNHLDIRAVPDLPAGPWPDAAVDFIGDIPVVTLHRETEPTGALFLKRLLDLVGAALGLACMAPAMAVVALLIRLESPGPVLYAAERMGAKGRRFRCYKFRSMVTNANHLKDDLRAHNQREGPIFKIVDDPRLTRVGRFIRRYSLDELPQLWNVLLGDMSLVGPRPHPIDDVNRYRLHDYRRLDVKPGLTGLWQITARHSPSFELNMHLDLTYIENWSLLLDFRILLGTIRVLFAPEGA